MPLDTRGSQASASLSYELPVTPAPMLDWRLLDSAPQPRQDTPDVWLLVDRLVDLWVEFIYFEYRGVFQSLDDVRTLCQESVAAALQPGRRYSTYWDMLEVFPVEFGQRARAYVTVVETTSSQWDLLLKMVVDESAEFTHSYDSEVYGAINAALSELSQQHRDVWKAHWQGMGNTQISVSLSIPAATVRHNLEEVRETLLQHRSLRYTLLDYLIRRISAKLVFSNSVVSSLDQATILDIYGQLRRVFSQIPRDYANLWEKYTAIADIPLTAQRASLSESYVRDAIVDIREKIYANRSISSFINNELVPRHLAASFTALPARDRQLFAATHEQLNLGKAEAAAMAVVAAKYGATVDEVTQAVSAVQRHLQNDRVLTVLDIHVQST